MLKQSKYLYWLVLILAIVDVAAAVHWHYWQDQHSRWEKIMVQLEPHAALKTFPMDDQSHLIHRLLIEKEDIITVVENIIRQRNLILSSMKSDSTQHHRYEFDVIGSFSSLVLLLHDLEHTEPCVMVRLVSVERYDEALIARISISFRS
jgi:hypothetical protein